jgi:L-fuconolactonase
MNASTLSSPSAQGTVTPTPRLDSHQHFWRYSPEEYPWIPRGSALERDWLPSDLDALQKSLGLEGSIAVQARQSIAESDWLLGLADANPRIRGVVGWVDLRAPDVGRDLARLARHPKFVGVRHVVQDEPEDDFVLGAAFMEGIRRLQEFGLAYDILVFPRQLPATLRFVEQFPDQPFVLDHIAKPHIKEGSLQPWADQIRALARFQNVVCKVSGMVTEADHARWKPADFTPYLDVVVEAFGPGRLMFGSDWPVCRLAGSYEAVEGLVRDHFRGWGAEDHAAFWGGTCAAFYGV